MLNREDNETLVRVGPGTPMGNLMRRFWIPAVLSSEVPEPDSPPVRVTLLGEKLVAFRDTTGQVGLLDAYCPHRGAGLFWGRNEECGLRCLYHGWKFDVKGNCVDAPNVAENEHVQGRIKTLAYPTLERGGMIWAYMGPPEAKPEFPATEAFNLPAENRHMQKMIVRGNWLQFMEGDIDSSHVSFLHRRLDGQPVLTDRPSSKFQFTDSQPKYTIKQTDYGMLMLARRHAEGNNFHWRATQWLFPFASMIPAPVNSPFTTNIRVPLDDEHTAHIRIYGRPGQPLTADDRQRIATGPMFPEMIPNTFTTKDNIDNDYNIDREDQRTTTYSGIKSVPVQDYAVTQDQFGGPISDRSREHLVKSDMAITLVRRRLLKSARALAEGAAPPEASRAGDYGVRPIDIVCESSVSADEVAAKAAEVFSTSSMHQDA